MRRAQLLPQAAQQALNEYVLFGDVLRQLCIAVALGPSEVHEANDRLATDSAARGGFAAAAPRRSARIVDGGVTVTSRGLTPCFAGDAELLKLRLVGGVNSFPTWCCPDRSAAGALRGVDARTRVESAS